MDTARGWSAGSSRSWSLAPAEEVLQPKDWLVSKGMGAIEDFSPAAIKVVGAPEVLGGLGVVLAAM